MKCTKYVTKITESVILPEVQFKCSYLQSHIRNSAMVSCCFFFFLWSSSCSFWYT